VGERLDDVWITRDYPVLVEVTRRVDQTRRPVRPAEISEALGVSADQVQAALAALRRRGLIDTADSRAMGGPATVVAVRDVAGAAYLMTGLHPDADDALTGLVEILRQAADQVGDEEERPRLRRAADAITGVSRDVMVGVMTAYATKYGVH
jgi:predicted ArsR family transcriptional regulator